MQPADGHHNRRDDRREYDQARTAVTLPPARPNMERTKTTRQYASVQYQYRYSERRARPVKFAWLLRTFLDGRFAQQSAAWVEPTDRVRSY